MKCQTCFFTGIAIKIAVSVNCCTTSMTFSYKDVFKDLALDLVSSFGGLLYFIYNFGQ